MPISAADLQAAVRSFPWDEWTRDKLGPGFEQVYRGLVVKTGTRTARDLGEVFDRADPFLSSFMTSYVGERIVSIEGTSKDRVIALVRRVLDEGAGLSSVELGKLVQTTVEDAFDEMSRWRANMIARTEVAIAENHGTVLGSSQAGVTEVDVFDGEDDEECAAANGQVWSISEALENPIAHPNCVRAFSPHVQESAS